MSSRRYASASSSWLVIAKRFARIGGIRVPLLREVVYVTRVSPEPSAPPPSSQPPRVGVDTVNRNYNDSRSQVAQPPQTRSGRGHRTGPCRRAPLVRRDFDR